MVLGDKLIVSRETTQSLLSSINSKDLESVKAFTRECDKPGECITTPSGHAIYRGIKNEMEVGKTVSDEKKRFYHIFTTKDAVNPRKLIVGVKSVWKRDVVSEFKNYGHQAHVFSEDATVGHLMVLDGQSIIARMT